jgi:SAM-dependent methyltransferase
VLRTRAACDQAISQVKVLGLPLVSDPPKNWDCLAALDVILATTTRRAPVLDAGAERYSQLLPWLALYGYRRLEGINLAFTQPERRGPILYRYGDITRTDYPPATFDAIACLSVIEHGVDPAAFVREMTRILKPGGVLVVSTDYWPEPVETRGQVAYSVPVHIFTAPELRALLAEAEQEGLVLTGPLDLRSDERVVHWRQVDLDYTFVIFTLRKDAE